MAQKAVRAQVLELPKITRNFATNRPIRTRVFKGGRGSGKTRGLAKRSAIRDYQLAELGVSGVFLSSREFMNSLEESSMEEIKQGIASEPWLADYFDIGEKYIRTKNRRIDYVFAGLRHNLDSIKSKSRIIGNWTDEAESVSEVAWRKLTGTLREEGEGWVAENWISYNPESPDSATHKRFVIQQADDCALTEINWSDNPWFPKLLNIQRLEDQRLRPDTYDHVWEGAFLTNTEAQIFHGKFEVEEFTPQWSWDGPYQGGDFGFSQDPTAAVRVWIGDGCLWVEYEAGKTGLELDDTGKYLTERIPDFANVPTRWDNARPESISHIRRARKHDADTRVPLPRTAAVEKWPGSVEDGIAFMRSFDKIIIHPRCPATAREFRLYSYKVDRMTQDVTPVVVDAYNHYIDAIRYALAPIIKLQGSATMVNSGLY
jgi:phage terminase large subunit